MKKNTKYIDLRIDWSDVRFHDKTTWPRIGEDAFKTGDKSGQGDVNENDGNALKAEMCIPHSSILFQTKFENDTDDYQVRIFSFESINVSDFRAVT